MNVSMEPQYIESPGCADEIVKPTLLYLGPEVCYRLVGGTFGKTAKDEPEEEELDTRNEPSAVAQKSRPTYQGSG